MFLQSCRQCKQHTRAPFQSKRTRPSNPRAVGVSRTTVDERQGHSFDFLVDIADVKIHTKVRLDAYLAIKLGDSSSRAKIQSSIRDGHVAVNGKVVVKTSGSVRIGDRVEGLLPQAPPLQAEPENIPLDIVFEDDHVMVVNKPAGMVVHISPGHHHGTLVNALLHHCGLQGVLLDPRRPPPQALLGGEEGIENGGAAGMEQAGVRSPDALHGDLVDADADDVEDGDADVDDDEVALHSLAPGGSSSSSSIDSTLRPGIVHRLDKGTTGLLVVAKTEAALRHLMAQFKARTVSRVYQSITVGVPTPPEGRVEANVGRHAVERQRMAAYSYGSSRGRTAASGYRVVEVLACGGAARVEWRLDTGRTHQIRVHAQHIGHPLVGDDTYSGASTAAVAAVARYRATRLAEVGALLRTLGRPALHAQTLGFDHPVTGRRLEFTSELPVDLVDTMAALRSWA